MPPHRVVLQLQEDQLAPAVFSPQVFVSVIQTSFAGPVRGGCRWLGSTRHRGLVGFTSLVLLMMEACLGCREVLGVRHRTRRKIEQGIDLNLAIKLLD